VDAVIVVSASADVQRARVLARPGMTEEKYSRLLARQMPDAEKRRRADFVVATTGSLEETAAEIARIAHILRERAKSSRNRP
jgi:dephospho-CoA kinase